MASRRLRAPCFVAALAAGVADLITSGMVTNVWPIAGPPDVTFFNPATGRVHMAIGEPGGIDTIHPEMGDCVRTPTGAGLTRRPSSYRTGFT